MDNVTLYALMGMNNHKLAAAEAVQVASDL
jgi:hypothetical protein